MTASVWNPAGTSANTANANNTYQAQKFVVAIAGQTLFSLTDFSYIPGTGSLLVEINGVDQYIGDDFLETNGVQVTFTSGLALGDIVVIRGLVGITGPAGAAALAAMAAIQLLNVPALPLSLNAGGTGIAAASPNVTFNALAPSTTKGDMIAHTGIVNQRVGAGAHNSILRFDPNQPTGVSAVSGGINISTRVINTQLGIDDIAKLILGNGVFTQTFDTPDNLGADWYCYIKILDGAELTIPASDGRVNWKMYAGELRLFQSNGATLTSYVLHPYYVELPSTVTFIPPPGYRYCEGILYSGGASGQAVATVGLPARGGAGGGAFPFIFPSSVLGTSILVTVGGGGASVSGSTAGLPGGDSSIGSLLTVKGASVSGTGGAIAGNDGATTANGIGFESSTAGVTPRKGTWGGATSTTDGSSPIGANSVYGGASGGGASASGGAGAVSAGGTSIFAGNGGASAVPNNNAVSGTIPAGGGGCVQGTGLSGAGGRGQANMRGIV